MGLTDISGQDRALRILKSLLKSRRLPPALLFSGPPDVGKKTAALAFAQALLCESQGTDACGLCRFCLEASKGISPNIALVNAAYQAGLRGEEEAKQASIRVETARHVIRELELRPLAGLWKVAIVEDARLLVPAAANAMLKALEEPPPQTLWILLTHRKSELLPTVLSRCQEVKFAPLAGAPAVLDASPEKPDWTDPMTPFRLAEGLPRELHLARPAVEERLRRLAWDLRESSGASGYSNPKFRQALRTLAWLRRALEANADPRLILELAALEVERLSPQA